MKWAFYFQETLLTIFVSKNWALKQKWEFLKTCVYPELENLPIFKDYSDEIGGNNECIFFKCCIMKYVNI